jgi:hypothetical protein
MGGLDFPNKYGTVYALPLGIYYKNPDPSFPPNE